MAEKNKSKKALNRRSDATFGVDNLAIQANATTETASTLSSDLTPNSIINIASSIDNSSSTFKANTINPEFEGYETMGICSDSMIIKFDECKEKIAADNIFEHDFAKDEIIQCCIYYLYGKGYACGKSPEERIKAIKKCVDKENGNFHRLRSFALFGPSDKLLFNQKAEKRYVELAITTEVFFRENNAKGGFPGTPFFRFQGSSCCYLVAAGAFYSLQLQRDFPEKRNLDEVLDVAQYVRRNLLISDDAINQRVVRDKGGFSHQLAEELTGRYRKDDDWSACNFEKSTNTNVLEILGCLAIVSTETLGPGLVTNFKVSNSVWETVVNNEQQDKLGYWIFDGDFNAEGTFREIENPNDYEDLQKRFQHVMRSQKQRAQRERDEPQNLMRGGEESSTFARAASCDLFDASPTRTAPSTSSNVSTTGRHAMVMLGGYKKTNENGEEKAYILLLNWWEKLPLILVTPEYLHACEAQILFLDKPLTEETSFNSTRAAMAECASPDFNDGGDGPPSPEDLSYPRPWDHIEGSL